MNDFSARRGDLVIRPGRSASLAETKGADELVAVNDARLARLLRSPEERRELEIGRLITDVAAPVLDAILARYGRRSTLLAQDAGDIAAGVHIRLLVKLRELFESPDEGVLDFERYVAGLTYNAVNDHLRAAFPARSRLKNRLRYVLMRDPRLALWTAGGELVAGLAEWNGRAPATDRLHEPGEITAAMLDPSRPGDALFAMLRSFGAPVPFDALVDVAARLWNVSDVQTTIAEADGVAGGGIATASIGESIDLHKLWDEIRALRPLQRKALLLNLRSTDSGNVIALFANTGVASFEALAEALERTPDELAAIWDELPLEDAVIAGLLGITRQQVINLRKSAREKLARRMSR
jgi:hypothetical protein